MSLINIGISGWTYDGWRGNFYPKKLSQKNELHFASREVSSIEVNGTFYGLQKPTSFLRWYEATPGAFIFSIKANRFITHIKRLNSVEISVANFFASGLLALKEKLGPILWQLPPSMIFDPDQIETFLKFLPRSFKDVLKLKPFVSLTSARSYFEVTQNYPIRHALEVRNMSFLNPWFVELAKKYNVAIVFADTAGKWPYIEDLTSDFIYIRLHGDSKIYSSGYDDKTLDFWAHRIRSWKKGLIVPDQQTLTNESDSLKSRDVFVYFDNDQKVRAPVDAKTLKEKLTLPF